MQDFPEPQNETITDPADVLNDPSLIAGPEGSSQASMRGDEVGGSAPFSRTPTLTPTAMVSRDALQPPAGLPTEGVSGPTLPGQSEALREVLSDGLCDGLPKAFAEGVPVAVPQGVAEATWDRIGQAFPQRSGVLPPRVPRSEPRFEAAPYLALPPLVDLSALPPRSPPQIALAHRPWEHSTGPRTVEGKQQAARNGKNRQIGVLSVRELRTYKKGQKSLLETLGRTLILARAINRVVEEMVEEVKNSAPQD